MTSYEHEVVEVWRETSDARSISFAVPDEIGELFDHRPGQFLTLAVPCGVDGATVARCYSLSSAPGAAHLTVTVKRVADGWASAWLCERLQVGDTLRVLPPAGVFSPASLDRDLLLLGAGSGITPLMSMVRAVLVGGTGRVRLLYANRDADSVVFADGLVALAAAHPDRLEIVHWLEDTAGLPTRPALRELVAAYADREAFVCGPTPFMEVALGALDDAGVPRDRRHRERFLSLTGDPFGDRGQRAVAERELRAADGVVGVVDLTTVEVELDGSTHVYDDWARGTTLLEQLESKGLGAPYSCREGECSSCAVTLLSGKVSMHRNEVLDDDDLADGLRLACQALPITDTVRVAYG